MHDPPAPSMALRQIPAQHPTYTNARTIATSAPTRVQEGASFACAICDGPGTVQASTAVLANPYSRWLILQCSACGEVAARP